MILLQDCIEGMKELEDGSIDAIVTSPPYNLNIKYGKYADNKPKQDYLDWIRLVFKEGKRILKDDGHLFVNMGYSNIDPYVGMEVAMTLRYDWVLQNILIGLSLFMSMIRQVDILNQLIVRDSYVLHGRTYFILLKMVMLMLTDYQLV